MEGLQCGHWKSLTRRSSPRMDFPGFVFLRDVTPLGASARPSQLSGGNVLEGRSGLDGRALAGGGSGFGPSAGASAEAPDPPPRRTSSHAMSATTTSPPRTDDPAAPRRGLGARSFSCQRPFILRMKLESGTFAQSMAWYRSDEDRLPLGNVRSRFAVRSKKEIPQVSLVVIADSALREKPLCRSTAPGAEQAASFARLALGMQPVSRYALA